MNWRVAAQVVLVALGALAIGTGMDAIWTGSGTIPIGAALVFAAWAIRKR